MAVKCKNCGGPHPTWECTKPKAAEAAASPRVGDRKPRQARAPSLAKSTGAAVGPAGKRGATTSATKLAVSPTAEKGSKRKSDTLGKVAGQTKSTAARKDVPVVGQADTPDDPSNRGGIAGTQAPPVDPIKRSRGRPKTIANMTEYKRLKQREYRARKKESNNVQP